MQPTFIPWAGYFGLIKYVDKFVFLDDVQFERRSWQQRNKIYEKNDFAFITIPIIKKNLRSQKICETRISINKNFKKKQIKRILQNYSRSEYFNNYNYFLNDILLKDFKYLSEMNIYLICEICKIIGIKTDFIKSSDLKTNGNKSEKLINICKKLNSSKYISVEGSKLYIEKDINLFNQIKSMLITSNLTNKNIEPSIKNLFHSYL